LIYGLLQLQRKIKGETIFEKRDSSKDWV
jgi:hypothetical protein